MTRWRLTPGAIADIDQIWDYTAARWTVGQADHYTNAIRAAIESAAQHPRRAPRLNERYRRARAGFHLIFYREEESGIVVVRVLHERMDVSSRLP